MLKAKIIRRFDELAPSRDAWKEKNQYYYQDRERYMRFLVPEGSEVLELGCGTGELLHALKPSRGVGVDFSGEMIRIARERFPRLEFVETDIENLDGVEGKFDFLILDDVIGHFQDIQTAFRALRAFCRADTRIIVTYYSFLWEPVLKFGERLGQKMPQAHQNWLATEDIANLLWLERFEVVKTEPRLLLPKRVPWLSEAVNRFLAPLPGLRKLCLCRYVVARPLGLREKRSYSTTILVPARNEAGNVEAAVKRIPQFGGHQEMIFVEGGSTDDTRQEIQRVMEAYPHKDIKMLVQSGKGKGDAVRTGFSEAAGEILMILDGDLTMPPEDLPKFYDAIAGDTGEFINGCRLVYPMEKEAMRFLNLLGNKFFSMMFTWILNQRFKDTLCGTKVLFRKDYEKIQMNRGFFGDFDPFGDFDLIFGAVKQNLKVVEVPIRYRERTYGSTNISRFRHGWLLLKMTLFAYRKMKSSSFTTERRDHD